MLSLYMPMKIGNSAFLLQAKDRGRWACADAVLMTSPYFVFNSACILSGTGVATYIELVAKTSCVMSLMMQ